MRFMIIPMLCVTIFVILVVWFLLPRVARLMIHTPTAISIFVCLSMVQLMAVFISMRCTLCGHFLQVALTLILVVGYAIAAKIGRAVHRNAETDLVCRLLLEKKNAVVVGDGGLLKSRIDQRVALPELCALLLLCLLRLLLGG